jgi:hypothetical protein
LYYGGVGEAAQDNEFWLVVLLEKKDFFDAVGAPSMEMAVSAA